MNLTIKEFEKYRTQLRALSNSAQYDKAYKLAAQLMKHYPKVIFFARCEAVYAAEDSTGYTKKQITARKNKAALKLRHLLRRVRGTTADVRKSLRNEYYWFSEQPYKQYRLGLSEVKKNYNGAKRGAYYSQGVGSTMLAEKYAKAGKKSLAIKWARKSEKAWINFFKIDANWFNSYFFYAKALGFQNRLKESEQALYKGAKIAKKPKSWIAIKERKQEILSIHKLIYG